MRFDTILSFTLAIAVESFAPNAIVPKRTASPTTALKFSRLDLIGKEFQLEEREDQDSTITELWLRDDGSVQFGMTDGPLYKTAQGSWSIKEDFKGQAKGDHAFHMTLVRTYEGGEHTGKNQVGNFDFRVQRDFMGDVDRTGNFVSVHGQIHGDDAGKKVDCEVGFFSMIDEAAEDMKVTA